ncbi:MAG: hypothetical protein ACI9WU_002930 [Myxococcota bacterium]|jgi:hypothetical protein
MVLGHYRLIGVVAAILALEAQALTPRAPTESVARQRATPDHTVTKPPRGASERGVVLHAWSERDASTTALDDDASGRTEPPGLESEDVVLLVPRLALAIPGRFVDLALRPVAELMGLLDRHAVLERVDAFLHNEAHTAGVVPTFGFQSGYGAAFGLKAFHDDLLGHGEHLSFLARTGGAFNQDYELYFSARRLRGSRVWLEGRFRYGDTPGLLFHGLGDADTGDNGTSPGPRDASVETRFQQERFLSLLRVGVTMGKPGQSVRVGAAMIHNFRNASPQRDPVAGDRSIESVYDTTRLDGFESVFNTLEFEANVVVDFRNRPARTSSGWALELFGGGAPPVDGFAYWHYGAEASVYINLYRETRVLLLRAAFEAVDDAGYSIPFQELPRLGGAFDLRGYLEDRFRDKRAAVASVEYHWPIHDFVSGELFLDAGRVGPTYRSVFGADAWQEWRVGYGGGIIVSGPDSVIFRADVSYGDQLTFFITTDLARAFKGREAEL